MPGAAVQRVPVANEMDGYIAEWIANSKDRIFQAFQLHGGWEGWAQVELAFFLSTRFFHHSLLREQRVFGDPNQEIDIWLQSLHGNAYPNIGVELKCRTAAATGNSFRGKIIEDIDKVMFGPDLPRNPSLIYAVAITMEQRDLDGYASVIDPTINSQVYFHQVVTDPLRGNIYMVWWQQSFN